MMNNAQPLLVRALSCVVGRRSDVLCGGSVRVLGHQHQHQQHQQQQRRGFAADASTTSSATPRSSSSGTPPPPPPKQQQQQTTNNTNNTKAANNNSNTNSTQQGIVKAPEVAARHATIAKLRKKEEEEAKYGASKPKAVIIGVAGAIVAASVLGAWLLESGLLNWRSRMRSLMGEDRGRMLDAEHKCNKTCAACDKSLVSADNKLTGGVVVVGGELLHPHHHVCHQCKTPLQDATHFMVDGKSYCERDFQFLRGRECAVCGDRLHPKSHTLVNGYGDVYCGSHANLPSCASCHRLVSARTTNGGVTRGDGRVMCGKCGVSSISTPVEANELLERVRADVEAITGLDLGREEIRVTLVPPKHFGADGVHTRGVTKKHVQRSMMRSRVISRSVDCVELLDGLPRLEAGLTLAHEIMHCHVFMRAFPDMPRVVEEGLCELVSYLWLAAQAKQPDTDPREVSFRLNSMERNTSRIYGQGFHLALRSFMVSDMTFSDFMSTIQKTGRLPVGPPPTSTSPALAPPPPQALSPVPASADAAK